MKFFEDCKIVLSTAHCNSFMMIMWIEAKEKKSVRLGD